MNEIEVRIQSLEESVKSINKSLLLLFETIWGTTEEDSNLSPEDEAGAMDYIMEAKSED